METTSDILGWFPEESRKLLDLLIEDYGVKSVIEVGAFVGLSTVFFAQKADVVSIDTFDALTRENYLSDEHKRVAKDQYREFLRNTLKFPNVRGIKLTSLEASTLPITADLIYIDASHRYEDVKEDIEAWKPKAKMILCGDDYHWPEVKQAVDESGLEIRTNGRVWYAIQGQ